MTQEDKELLLKDLCTRLPYGVIVDYKENEFEIPHWKITTIYPDTFDGWIGYDKRVGAGSESGNRPFNIGEVKPYLRPMSSMIEEEKKDILQSLNIHGDIDNEGNLLLGVECDIITLKVCKKYLGELNKRMFDVCHMIEKGLALEAPEGMYNIN